MNATSRPAGAGIKISLEGNISSGKTTVLTKLSDVHGVRTIVEPVESWTLLSRFYDDPRRWCLSLSTQILLSLCQPQSAPDTVSDTVSVHERSCVSCKNVFFRNSVSDGHVDPDETAVFEGLYSRIAWTPEAFVYLRTDPATCFARMKRRGRPSERGVSVEYLENIHRGHDRMFEDLRNRGVRVIEVDGDREESEVLEAAFVAIAEIRGNAIADIRGTAIR